MSQLVAVALGGAFGAVLRFFVSTGVYQWLGRGFPYGTLAVNVIGSMLIGLLTEALILQRVEISQEYRAAILVGVFGSFTTFSTFSLETLYLLEQGHLTKAALNVMVSVSGCIVAVWIGLQMGRVLFMYSGGVFRWMGWVFPYALVVVNVIGAFIIGMVMTVLLNKVSLSIEHSAAILILLVGMYITLSGLYLILFLIEDGHSFALHSNLMLMVFLANALFSASALWLGLFVGRQIP
jgi:CrcB protein